jgi:hypothetical protein
VKRFDYRKAALENTGRPSIGTLMTPTHPVPPWTERDERGLHIMMPFFIVIAILLVGAGGAQLLLEIAMSKLKKVPASIREFLSSGLDGVGW